MSRMIYCLCLSIISLSFAASNACADQKMFAELKCTKCHGISSLGVKSTASVSDDEEEAGPPDLSGTGKFHDAAFFAAYLKKETPHVLHDGKPATKKHVMKFGGTDEQLKVMADWLATLK